MSGLNLGDLSFNVYGATDGLQKSIDVLKQFSAQVTATANTQTDAAQAAVASYARQESAIKSALQQTLSLQSSLRNAGAPPQLLAQTTNAFSQFTKIMTAGALSSLEFTRAQDQLTAKSGNVKRAMQDMSQEAPAGEKSFGNYLRDIQSAAILATGPLGGISSRVGQLAAITDRSSLSLAAFAAASVGTVAGLIALSKAAIDTQINFDKINALLLAGAGSQQQAADNFQHVHDVAMQLGEPLDALADGYAKLSVATQNTGLAGQKTRQVFDDVSSALNGVHASSEQISGTFNALTQMVNRGQISTRELVAQFRDTFPGAAQIAQKALGLTTVQMKDMMQAGTLAATSVLPKFAQALKDTFGSPTASDSLEASLARLTTSWQDFLLAFNQASGTTAAFKTIISGLTSTLEFLAQNMTTVIQLVGALTGILTLLGARSLIGLVIPAIAAFITGIAEAGTALAAMEISVAALAGPLGLLALVVGAAAAGFYLFGPATQDASAGAKELQGNIQSITDQANKGIPVLSSLADTTNNKVTAAIKALNDEIVKAQQNRLDLGNIAGADPTMQGRISGEITSITSAIQQYQEQIVQLKQSQQGMNSAIGGQKSPTDNFGTSNAVTSAMEKIKQARDELNELQSNPLADNQALSNIKAIDSMTQELKKAGVAQSQINDLTAQYGQLLNGIDGAKIMDDMAQATAKSQREIAALARGLSPEQFDALDKAQVYIKGLVDAGQTLPQATQNVKNFTDTQTQLNTALTNYKTTTDQVKEANKQIDDFFGNDLATALTNTITATQSVSQAFSNMFVSIFDSLSKMLIQYAITQPLANSIKGLIGLPNVASSNSSSSTGGLFSFLGNAFGLSGFADGGSVSGGVPIVVGENGPEIFSPGSNGYITPNSPSMAAMRGGSSGGNSNAFNINVQVSGPAGSNPQQAAKAGAVISQQIKGAISSYITQQQRSGGQLYGTAPTTGGSFAVN